MEARNCFCGTPAIIRTSWTQANPGRRFYCCARTVQNCGYFGWAEPQLCARAMEIIPGLLNNMNNLRASARENANQARKWKWLLAFSWCLFVLYVVMN
ncbi:zinc finger, GRF-type [Artemisia annua]|uniref:Zinc finger, GRF-type n=1 Tax=Artemisia annua TaxID=35608 RepID=A0A2U1QGP4_ARTAN|nr:zinc finger, GRF-type [Artemisia annua]